MFKEGRKIWTIVGTVALALGVARTAQAGPPLICHPFEVGSAPVLPWAAGQNWNNPDRSYDVQRLTADTLRLLTPDTPVLARMENLRRATIYASQDREVAAQLLSAVLGKALAVPGGSRDPLAWFDAGYLVESYRQATTTFRWDMLSAAERERWTLREAPASVDGYAYVRKAIDLAGTNPEMEFAASLMKSGTVSAEHRRRAEAGATRGSLLARNLSH